MSIAASRFAIAVGTLLVTSVLVFAAIHHVPGGYADVLLGPFQSEAAQARVAEQYHLGDPLPVQYWAWLRNVFTGDLGVSLVTQDSVAAELWRRTGPTFQLTLMASVMAAGIGVPLGFVAAIADNRPVVRALCRIVGASGLSVPDFVLGTALVYAFSRWSLWLTVGGYVPFIDDPVDNLRAMALPTLCLGVFGIALVMRTTRDAVLTTLAEPFVTAAVARGERPATVVRRHLVRNSSLPIVTVLTTYVGVLLGGAVIVENLFGVPGIGSYVVNSIRNRDYAVLQGGVLVAAAIVIVANMLADSMYALIDPRLKRAQR